MAAVGHGRLTLEAGYRYLAVDYDDDGFLFDVAMQGPIIGAARQGTSSVVSGHERIAVKLCACGLIAEIVTAAVDFFVGNQIWPNFYFEPVQMGKYLWLAAQGLSITVFFVGTCYAAAGIRRAAAQGR